MTTRQYKDVAGNPCSLDWLVRNEPEWAANQIRHRDKLDAENKTLKETLDAIANMPEYDQDDAHRLRNIAKRAAESANDESSDRESGTRSGKDVTD